MAHTKSTYYREWVDGDGIARVETIVLPSDGDWAARYAERGFSTVPPENFGAPVEPDGLDELTVAELKALAADEGIPVEGNRPEILAGIRTKRLQRETIEATKN